MANFFKRLFGKKEPEITPENENAQANTPQVQPTQDESEKNTDKRERLLDTWLRETSNGLLAAALKKATGKTLVILNARDGGPGDFVFDNIRIHSWFSNFGVNSDYQELGAPDIVLPLYTWAKCAEIRTAANLLYEEKGINVVTDNVLSTTEACSLSGLPKFDLAKELEKELSKLPDEPECLSSLGNGEQKDPIKDFLSSLGGNLSSLRGNKMQYVDFVLEGMNEILHPEFSIHRNTLTNEIYIKANYQSLKDVEEQSPLFKNKIKSIVDYFYNDADVQKKLHNC